MYQRDTFQDAFYTSPNPDPSSEHLSPYSTDARRNSDVSAFSLSSFNTYASDFSVPPTPICGRSPFVTKSFDTTAMDMNHAQSNQLLPMDYQMKDVVFGGSLHEPWSLTDSSMQVDQTLAVQVDDEIPLHGNFLDPQAASYMVMSTNATNSTSSWCGSSSTTAYSGFESPLTLHEFNIDQSAPMPSVCYFQASSTQAMAPPALETRSLLGGDYIHVEASHDLGMEQYDDTDVPLLPSPQDVVFKQESSPIRVKPESGTPVPKRSLKRSLKRSIYETRTGGKSVMTEQRANSVSKCRNRGRKSKSRPGKKEEEDEFDWNTGSKSHVVFKMQNGKVLSNLHDFVKLPDGKYVHAHQEPVKKYYCKHPYSDDDKTIPDDHPGICGRRFQRPEHRQRHRYTHSGEKNFVCKLCPKAFGRNDNCSAHWFTHVLRPGKKLGSNSKFSLRQVISVISDPKLMEKLLKAWEKEVKKDYLPEEEEEDNPNFQNVVEEINKMEFLFTYDAEDAVRKIRNLIEALGEPPCC